MISRRKLLFAGLLLLIAGSAYSQAFSADKITGTWESRGSDISLRFDIFKTDGKYFGKLLWASDMFEADGKTPKKDFNNPDETLRGRSRQNIVNVTDLIYKNGEYSGGKLYNPSDGRTYSLNAKLKNEDQLEFRGYMGISWLGRTITFKRVVP